MRKNRKKNNENIKDDENHNTVVSNITEIFVFLVKDYLTVTSLKILLIFLSLEIYVSNTKNYLIYKLKVSLASFDG
jgi:hypothetical protein